MQRSCEPRGQEEFLIFDVGFWIGAKIAHAMVAKPRLWSGRRRGMQRSTGRGEGGWPYYVPQTVLRRVVKMCSYFVPRLRVFEGHGIGLAEL
jgi:hypothetical protein